MEWVMLFFRKKYGFTIIILYLKNIGIGGLETNL